MRKNIWLKAASVLLAVAMWFYVISKGQTVVSMEVQVGFTNTPQTLQINTDTVKPVVVEIRGHERFIERLMPDDISITVDASRFRRGKNHFTISSENLEVPKPLKLINITPTSLTAYAYLPEIGE